MANQEERLKGLETTTTGLRERVARIEGKLDSSPTSKTTNAYLIPIISAICLALLGYLGWIGAQVVDYGRKLTALEEKLTVLGLQSQAYLPQPTFEKVLPDVRSAITIARKERINVPSAVIEGLRSKLLASNSELPDFWPTLSEFVSYRSSLSYHAAATPSPVTEKDSFAFVKLPDCTDSLPKPMKVKEVLGPHEITQARGLYENCRFLLDSPKQDQVLNDILRGSTPLITFKNCVIEYHGGDINLILAWDKAPFALAIVGKGPEDPTKVVHTTLSGPAIQFENCLFVFEFQNSPPPNGQRLATALLTQNATSVSLPVSP